MPAAEVMLDSNVLVYALSDAPPERKKRNTAATLLAEQDFGTSYQVLMETWVVATRRMAKPVPEEKVAVFLDRVLAFPCVPGAADLYRQAFRLSRRYEIHPYDAAIVAAAQELGAHTLYSEDLSDGQEYDGVKVANPFLASR
jgi:predicted nucleic acid-binding protein